MEHPDWTSPGNRVAIVSAHISGAFVNMRTVARRTPTLVILSESTKYRLQPDGTYRLTGDRYGGGRLCPVDDPTVLHIQAVKRAQDAGYLVRDFVEELRGRQFKWAKPEEIAGLQKSVADYADALAVLRELEEK